jgi:hypothetical protein
VKEATAFWVILSWESDYICKRAKFKPCFNPNQEELWGLRGRRHLEEYAHVFWCPGREATEKLPLVDLRIFSCVSPALSLPVLLLGFLCCASLYRHNESHYARSYLENCLVF